MNTESQPQPAAAIQDGAESETPTEQAPLSPPNPLARKVMYSFASAEIDALVGERLARIGKNARINGFRRGKIPMRIMQGRWGGQCLAEVLSEKAGAKFAEESAAMTERPASSPNIIPAVSQSGEEYRVECRYEAMPQIAAPDLSGRKIRRPTLEIGDAEIDEMIARLRQDSADYAEVARKAQSGDRIEVDFCVRRGDAVLEEGKNRQWLLDSPAIKGEVTETLIGAGAGDSREIVLKPEERQAAETANSDAPDIESSADNAAETPAEDPRMEIQIRKVLEPQLPELNAEFFARFGVQGGEDDFRKVVGERLKSEVAERARRGLHDQAMNALLAATPKFDLPRSLVRAEAGAMLSQMAREVRARGLPQAAARMTPQMLSEAARRVALGLIIAGWREREKIEISDSDVEARLDELAGGYEDPAEFKTRAMRDENMMHALRLEMLERRAAEWVCERADTADEKTPLSQLLAGGVHA